MKAKNVKKFEVRRIQAAKLLWKGESYSEIARKLGVTRESVRQWAKKILITRSHEIDEKIIYEEENFHFFRDDWLSSKNGYSYMYSYKKLRPQKLGRSFYLKPEEMGKLKVKMRHGAMTYGFNTNKWTLERVALMIHKEFNWNTVVLSKSQTMRILNKLGFSCKKPDEYDVKNYSKWEKYRWFEPK